MYFSARDLYPNLATPSTEEISIPTSVEQSKLEGLDENAYHDSHHKKGHIWFWVVIFLVVVVLYHLGARV